MEIGVIGLGHMGIGIARNIARAGHRLTVWNRDPAKAEALVAEGAVRAASPAEAAQGDVVVTMLANDAAVEAVTFGENGILTAKSRAIHVSMSTIAPTLVTRLDAAHREAGMRFLSAPVFGRPDVAAAGALNIVAAGDDDLIAACQPLFEAIGQRVFPVGDRPEQANIVKLSGNFMILAAVESFAEAMALGEKNGVAPATFVEVMTETLFGGRSHRVYGEILAEQRFRPAGFTAPLGLKDMNLVSALANDSRVPMPLLGVIRDHLLSAMAREGEDLDWSGLALAVRADAGL
ncbi:NAD(P)-dependent oxidoreductase [Sphingomonas sp. Sphisp140]|uniref:NAD(P)-dependent oxidoreductase n=1 Tax=unclassified Sphingomonas TaxID=196159 RepID=UPI0039AF5289